MPKADDGIQTGVMYIAAGLQLLPITADTFLKIKAILAADPNMEGVHEGLINQAISTNEANVAKIDAWIASHPKSE